ncbi:MAG: bluetail domain-containing putative surface protein [Synechococcaceae cyanobacterium]|nr:bluetail domain-containing putative surface protein [Synechococcaceae cyanobacterium]
MLADGVSVVSDTPLVDLSKTFQLHSNPKASKTIYLDFNGHTTSGTYWNDSTMGASFYSPAYDIDGNPGSFSTEEQIRIQQIWQRVTNDYAGLDVNVTTQAPPTDWLIKSSSSDPNYGVRVVITSYGPSSSTAGGIAYINSFTWNTDTPAFVYNTSVLGVSEAISHEAGHTLGLSHDGTSTTSYYQGHGIGETGWASIMGVGYYKNVTTWDDGTFYGSTNNTSSANYGRGPDDLAIITGYNGFGYLADQVGNSQDAAASLIITNGSVSQLGSIETALDQDWYRFELVSEGSINLIFDPYYYSGYIDNDGSWGGDATSWVARVSDLSTSTAWADNGANLDLSVALRDASGNQIALSNPAGLAASLNIGNLAAGTYFLILDGTGFGDPTSSTPSGYSDYASIGNYLISGSISGAATVSDPPPPAELPQVTLSLAPSSVSEDGSTNLVYTVTRSVASSDALSVNLTLGGSATPGTDYTGISPSGTSVNVTIAADATSTQLIVDPIADTMVENDETVSLTLATGSGYTVGTTSTLTGTIINDDNPPASGDIFTFTSGIDRFTAQSGSDTFQLPDLKYSLFTSNTANLDSVTGLQTEQDVFDSPLRSAPITAQAVGSVSQLTTSRIGRLLSKSRFQANGAAIFTFGSGSSQRTFLAINDGVAGYNASTDAIIELINPSSPVANLVVT